MASYRARALAIHSLVTAYRREIEAVFARPVSDRLHAIEVGVEIVNKLLYSFLLSQELFDGIDEQLNRHVATLTPEPHAVNMLLLRLLDTFRDLEACSRQWVERYGAKP